MKILFEQLKRLLYIISSSFVLNYLCLILTIICMIFNVPKFVFQALCIFIWIQLMLIHVNGNRNEKNK